LPPVDGRPGTFWFGTGPKFPSKFGYSDGFGCSSGRGLTTTNPSPFGPGIGSGSGDDGGLGFFDLKKRKHGSRLIKQLFSLQVAWTANGMNTLSISNYFFVDTFA